MKFQFRRIKKNDFVLLQEWFNDPPINQLYAENRVWSLEEIAQKYLPRIEGKQKIAGFIVYYNSISIGFIQFYSLADYLPEGIMNYDNNLFKKYDPTELVGIDFFIAIEEMRGKGLGNKLLTQFIDLYLQNYKAIVVDPEINNLSAIQCYKKSGFRMTNFSEDPEYGVLFLDLYSQ